MPRNPEKTVYIGNLDEKVNERVLYEILIQVGRVVDLYMPQDKKTNRHKGYAFAEYETEEIADYAVRLFSGLVHLHNRTLKFAISGQDKFSQNTSTPPVMPRPNSPPLPKPHPVQAQVAPMSCEFAQPIANCRFSGNKYPVSPIYPQASSNGPVSRGFISGNYEYSRHMFGAMLNNVRRPGGAHPVAYSSY